MLQWKVLIMCRIGLVSDMVCQNGGSRLIEQNILFRQVSGVSMKVGMIEMLLKLCVNIVLMKLFREKMVVVSIIISIVMFRWCICSLVKNSDSMVMIIFIVRLCSMLLMVQLRRMVCGDIGDISSFFIECWNLLLKKFDIMLLQVLVIIDIMIRLGMMYFMQVKLFILLICWLIKLLKIMKYRIMVIVGGSRVCGQIWVKWCILWQMIVFRVIRLVFSLLFIG